MLFERPMPTLAAVSPNEINAGRSFALTQTGDAISNAIFVRAQMGRKLTDELDVNLQFVGARTAKVPDDENDKKGYGMELDLSLNYAPFETVSFNATGGVFLPGSRFTEYEDDDYDGFESPAFGAQLSGIIQF